MEPDPGLRSAAAPNDRAAVRVLFLGHGAERTGPPILLGHLLRGLADDRRYGTAVLTARSGPMLAEYGAAGAHVRAVARGREPLEPLAAGLRRFGADTVVRSLQDRARARAGRGLPVADLVYVNAATPPTAALLRAVDPPPGVPVVLHVHELDIGLRLTLTEEDRTFLFGRADHVVAASTAVADLLVHGHHLDPARISTCPEFVDVAGVRPRPRAQVRRELGLPPDAAVVGSVGLPDWRKDPERLLHAVWHLRRARPELDPWVVWIGGDPTSDDGRHLADEAGRVGLADRLVHVPHQDHPDRLLGALDVFALPSRQDALPLAALEAAAAGLPVVCFRTGGVAALAGAGAGVAVDHPDVAAFGAALAALLADEPERARMGQRARQLVAEAHDVAPGVARIRRVLDALAAAPCDHER